MTIQFRQAGLMFLWDGERTIHVRAKHGTNDLDAISLNRRSLTDAQKAIDRYCDQLASGC